MAPKETLAMRTLLVSLISPVSTAVRRVVRVTGSGVLVLSALAGCAGGDTIADREDVDGAAGVEKSTTDSDRDGWTTDFDCNDADDSVYPGAQEICANEVDDDCDDLTDELDGTAARQPYCATADGDVACADLNADGTVDESDSMNLCNPAEAAVAVYAVGGDVDDIGELLIPLDDVAATPDCDDYDPAVYPDADEVCDGVVNDCNSTSTTPDDGLTFADYFMDVDGDGEGDMASEATSACEQPDGTVVNATDCDDGNPDVNSAATEVCDEVDNDCDTLTDDADDSVEGEPTWYGDGDGDGSGDVTVTWASCEAPMGYVESSDDCNDADVTAYPGADEVCDGVDDDCDEEVDEDAGDQTIWYRDYDADTYGRSDVSVVSCSQPSGYESQNGDCNDADADVNPGAVEVYDGIDQDCDGTVDDGALCGIEVGYDATGVSATSMEVSGTPSGVVDGEWADVDGDGMSDTTGVTWSSDNYGGLYLATATTETFCLDSGESFLVDITLADGGKGCVMSGVAEGSLYALQGGTTLNTAAYDNGDGTCQIEVSAP